MIIKIKKAQANKVAILSFAIFLIIALFAGLGIYNDVGAATDNITNETVITKVFVWNTEPNLYDVTLSPNPILLSPGNLTSVNCTGKYFDYNGYQDVANGSVNATLYDSNSSYSGDADDNNDHYTNTSCESSCFELVGSSGQNGTCTCTFWVEYYANASTWQCNMTIQDSGINITDPSRNKTMNASRVGNSSILELLALDVPNEIDFGNLSVTEISADVTENITNLGNTDFNITVRGFGDNNESAYNNLSMLCDLGNISIGAERYSTIFNQTYSSMTNLTGIDTQINGLTVRQRTNDDNTVMGKDVNETYWKIQIPLGVGGYCNGTIIFSAIEAFP